MSQHRVALTVVIVGCCVWILAVGWALGIESCAPATCVKPVMNVELVIEEVDGETVYRQVTTFGGPWKMRGVKVTMLPASHWLEVWCDPPMAELIREWPAVYRVTEEAGRYYVQVDERYHLGSVAQAIERLAEE